MTYNTERTRMIIPEYGRNVQKMVSYALSVEDREQRNKVARSIIDVIGNLNPHLRDVPDFKHKLWDHLFIMSNFKLDVDSPYPIPAAESFEGKPDTLSYPSERIRYRHYGKTIQTMIKTAIEMEDGEEKEALKLAIANHMKKCYLTWNRDTVEDTVILTQLKELSKGEIVFDPATTTLSSFNDIVRANAASNTRSNPRNNKKGKNNNNKGKRKNYSN